MPNRSDHDLLIQIDTKLNALTETVAVFGTRIEAKADRDDLIRLEKALERDATNIDALQRFKWMLLGSVAVLQIVGEVMLHVVLR